MELKQIENQRSHLIPTLFYGVFILSIIVVIGVLLQLKSSDGIIGDKWIATVAQSENEIIKSIFKVFTELGSVVGIGSLFLLSIVIIWWRYRDYVAMIVVAITVLGGDQANKLLKELIARERPSFDPTVYAEGYSFPSGHAMVGVTFYGFLSYFAITKLKSEKAKIRVVITMSIFIFLIGFSRIVLNAHYPSDVFGGFAIGFICLVACIFLYKGLTKLFKRT